jgi:hypothetical protein
LSHCGQETPQPALNNWPAMFFLFGKKSEKLSSYHKKRGWVEVYIYPTVVIESMDALITSSAMFAVL